MTVDFGQRSVSITALDLEVNPAEASDISELILDHIRKKKPLWIGNHNLHSAYLWNADEHFRRNYERADMWIIDGWPILAFAKRYSRNRNRVALSANERVGSTDWLQDLVLRGEAVSIVSVGATPTAARYAARHMNITYPWLTWRAYDGFGFERQDDADPPMTMDDALACADLVLVGMGMPHQERWIVENREKFPRSVVANIGGCIDYIAGEQELAPRWLGAIGMEWLYRLAKSPKRLAHRYLIEPLLLVQLLLDRRTQK